MFEGGGLTVEGERKLGVPKGLAFCLFSAGFVFCVGIGGKGAGGAAVVGAAVFAPKEGAEVEEDVEEGE